jgi:hypothetical protein
VQRHGNEGIGVERAGGGSEEIAERTRDSPAMTVFEPMNRVSEAAFVTERYPCRS